MADFPLSKQPTPSFEPDPLPGQEPSPTVGVHPQHVYERARAMGTHYAAQDELAMRKLREVTPRLQAKPKAPVLPETQLLPGFTGQGADFSITKARGLFKPTVQPDPPTTNPKVTSGPKRSEMTEQQKAEADERDLKSYNLAKYGVHPRPKVNIIPVTEIQKDTITPSNPGRPYTALDLHRDIGTMKSFSGVDVDAQNATGLDLPKPQKIRKPGLSASVKRAAESIANSHYEKSAAGITSGMDIKEAHGSALGYFKKTFTANGTNDEVDAHIRDNYSHMLIHEKPNRAAEFEAPRPPKSAKSSQQVKRYLQNPLSAYRGK